MMTSRPRVLFVSKTFPSDFSVACYGIFQRLRCMLEGASKAASELHLLWYVPPEEIDSPDRSQRAQDDLLQHWGIEGKVTLAPLSPSPGRLRALIPPKNFFDLPDYRSASSIRQIECFENCVATGFDAIFVHRLGAMCPLLRTSKPLPPVVLDLDDIEHRKFDRLLRLQNDGRISRKENQLREFLESGERQAVEKAWRTLVCSEDDKNYLVDRFGRNSIEAIPNSVEPPDTVADFPIAPRILFLGTYTYFPNVDAADYLLREIWPKLTCLLPQAYLTVAGWHPEKISCYGETHERVEFPGLVDDLAALYAETMIVCCPIRVGGGTRIKIIEAAAHGRPVVATRVGAEGLEFENGKEILLADTPTEFVDACLRLANDLELAKLIGKRAREKALKLYSRVATAESVSSLIIEASRSGKTERDSIDKLSRR